MYIEVDQVLVGWISLSSIVSSTVKCRLGVGWIDEHSRVYLGSVGRSSTVLVSYQVQSSMYRLGEVDIVIKYSQVCTGLVRWISLSSIVSSTVKYRLGVGWIDEHSRVYIGSVGRSSTVLVLSLIHISEPTRPY